MYPTPVAAALTALFLATGLLGAHALVRGRGVRVLGPCGDSRATELLHVLMSTAMIAMTWGWTGGPDTVGGIAQILVFGGIAAVLGALGARSLVGARRAARGARLSHALMAATTVWMVAAMPLLMSAPAVSTVLVALLVVVGLAWVVRAVQCVSPAHRARYEGGPVWVPAPRTAPDTAAARVPVGATGSAPPEPVREPIPRPAPTTAHGAVADPRSAVLAASCHALMGLGMAGMLAAML